MVLKLIILVCSIFTLLLTGCESSEPSVPNDVVIDEYYETSKDLFEYYELYTYLCDPSFSESNFDVVTELSHRISHLPTASSHCSVDDYYEGRASVHIEVVLSNGYYHSGEVMSMILDQLQLILNNSSYQKFDYAVRVEFDEGKEYFTSGGRVIDSGYSAQSFMLNE